MSHIREMLNVIGFPQKTVTLQIELTQLDANRLKDVIDRSLVDAHNSRRQCEKDGLTVAARMTWPATIDVLDRLNIEVKKVLTQFHQ